MGVPNWPSSGVRSPHCEGGIVRPPKWHACGYRLRRLQIRLSITLVIARVDERHRPFDQFHDRHVAGRAHLKRTELWRAIDHFRRVDRRHRDHLLEREAEARKLRQYPG